MEVQIFGTQKSSDTRKALRFFKERRVKVHFVDLKVRAASKGELSRFAQKFGGEALVDRDSKRFQNLGLGAAYYSDKRWLEILEEEPMILQQPLVRCQNRLTVGLAEEEWKGWGE
jgi:arsenate reductase-like glutaredoxin family protein